ncbi:hypothetical protein ACQKDS_05860 [Serratia sp. NPDC078593]|uniref:hypothetical protein n=1 Tax=unclassified Serratia (in: enterobacteria) TaxID=2647522 RepID=UPI0037D2371C
MCQSMMFKLVSLGVAMGNETRVDLRNLWRKMTLLPEISHELSHPQRALLTRGRMLMLEGPTRFLAFLQVCSKHQHPTPWLQELIALLEPQDLPVYLEDQTFLRHFNRMDPSL